MEIRKATSSDAASVAAVYNHYVEPSTITFEEEALALDKWRVGLKSFNRLLFLGTWRLSRM